MNKLCITMYVAGERYAHYIPIFIYFAKEAYPEYSILIAYKHELPASVRLHLELLKLFYKDFEVREGVFEDFPNDADTVKTLRWTMWFPQYNNFDYIYVGDIDILLFREEPTLLEQHLKVCNDTDNCYSNTTKIDDVKTRGTRMTGLHFFKREEYSYKMLPVMQKYLGRLRFNANIPEFYNKAFGRVDNQHALYSMIKESGLKLPEHSFFEYHGLHLGHSRVSGRWDVVFEDEKYRKFYNKFCKLISKPLFELLSEKLTPEIQNEIDTMICSGEKKCPIN